MHKLVEVVLAVALAVGCSSCSKGHEPTVAAAASLRQVLPELAHAAGASVRMTLGASGALAKEVEAGAPIDGVVLAAKSPVDDLVTHGKAHDETIVATNRLVLIGRPGGPALSFQTIDQLPKGELLAVGEPMTVPAGLYAKEALVALGKWDALAGRMVEGADVGAVLAYVSRGEAACGIVYATDVTHDVVLLDEASGPWAPRPQIVAAAVTSDARVAKLLRFLVTPEAQAIFARRGFGPP